MTEKLSPKKMEKYLADKAQCKVALDNLLAYCHTKAEMARKVGMATNTVSYWFTRGQVGRFAAIKFGKIRGLPFTKEMLRPDIKNWTVKKDKK